MSINEAYIIRIAFMSAFFFNEYVSIVVYKCYTYFLQNSLYLVIGYAMIGGMGCEGYWGKETETDFLDEPQFEDQTVAYVPVQPAIVGLDYPVDIIAGWDELIYVADAGTEEIIGYDQAGNEQGRFQVPGLTAIAQDRRLDMLALGTLDTLINGTNFTLPAIYRIGFDPTGDYGITSARIKRKIVHPFYFKSSSPTTTDELVRFRGISVLADNRYYVSRNGISNSVNQFGGPDMAVILFSPDDEFISPVVINTSLGLFRDFFKSPQGITTLAQPPQSPAVNPTGSFLATSVGEGVTLKVQFIERIETEGGASFELRQLPVGDTSRADRFLYEPNRFDQPVDVVVAGDETNYIFVVDAARDSLYQFNALGLEGVNPPPGARSNKVIRASFGGTGDELTQFREPRAVAYLDRIVYVADAGNGRILRFRLTTDFE